MRACTARAKERCNAFNGDLMKLKMTRPLSIALATLFLGACVNRAEIDTIKSNQEKILAKLDKLKAPAAAPPSRRGPDASAVYSMDVKGNSSKGPEDAWVTVVEVSDFQCPFCKRVNPTLSQLISTYKDDVRVVFKHNPLPFHKQAMPAAVSAECAADQGKFWEMHDKMFANQRALTDADLEKYAGEVGVDKAKWKSCFTAQKPKSRILADQRAASKVGARGTPAFFVNGRYLSGAQPFPRFKALVDEELKKAKASGLSKKDYYAKMVVAKGKKSL